MSASLGNTARHPVSVATNMVKTAPGLNESGPMITGIEDTPKVAAFGNMPISTMDNHVMTGRVSTSIGP